MFLFIFESIGTSELLLIGIVALIFLGPRKMPEMARKIGKMMAEFRGTANEFKETWQKEVNFDEEVKALNLNDLDAGPEPAKEIEPIAVENADTPDAPAIKAADPALFTNLAPADDKQNDIAKAPDADDKKNWL